ncbi:MAG: J domain-containing protein [Isosphaeraceae bacterium]
MLDGFQLDPYIILGIDRNATARDIRDAYRVKSKKYHPDLGGDEWAFRIVVKAYELLGEGREAGPPPPARVPSGFPIHPAAATDTGQVRQGIVDKAIDPARRVSVEIIWMRYEVEDVMELLNLSKADRNLSGTLHVTWPDPSARLPMLSPAESARIIRDLTIAFESVRDKTKVDSALINADEDEFEGWLSYPSGTVAWDAFRILHVGLKLRGLGVAQFTRDLSIPRERG